MNTFVYFWAKKGLLLPYNNWKVDFERLITGIQEWTKGNPYEKRTVATGLCEPILLKDKKNAQRRESRSESLH